jgi:hypothetical protein
MKYIKRGMIIAYVKNTKKEKRKKKPLVQGTCLFFFIIRRQCKYIRPLSFLFLSIPFQLTLKKAKQVKIEKAFFNSRRFY